jgi:hypothetical protein
MCSFSYFTFLKVTILSTFKTYYFWGSLHNAKEVHLYAEALKQGFALVQSSGLLTNNFIIINYASLSVYQSFKIDLMLNFVIF